MDTHILIILLLIVNLCTLSVAIFLITRYTIDIHRHHELKHGLADIQPESTEEAEANNPEQATELRHMSDGELLNWLHQKMDNTKLFCDPELDLKTAAQELGITQQRIKKAIRSNAGKARTFKDFLLEKRILYACSLLIDKPMWTVEAVCYEVGFKSRNADDTLCTSMQAVEYLKTIQVGRMVTSELGIYHIISGAFGAFDRKALQQVGDWDIGPGLDGDITQKFRKSGYKVVFAEKAISMTNVPTSWKALFKQRQRWSKSLVRFRLRKHANIFSHYKNFSFSNAVSNLECILYDFVFNYVWFLYIINLIFDHTDKLVEIFVIGYLLRIMFNFAAFATILCVSERRREEFHLVKYVPLNTSYTGYFMRAARLMTHTKELFFFSSYKDPWNPRKTSEIAQAEGF